MATQTKFLKLTIADSSEDIRPITNSNMLKIEKGYGGLSNQIGNLTNVVSQNNLVNVLRDTCIRFIEQDGEYWVQEYKWDNLKREWVEGIKTQNYFADAENFTGYYFKDEWTGVEDAEPPFNSTWTKEDILVINQTTTATGYGVDYRRFPQALGGYYTPTIETSESPTIIWTPVPTIQRSNSVTTSLPVFKEDNQVNLVSMSNPELWVDNVWTYTLNLETSGEVSDTPRVVVKFFESIDGSFEEFYLAHHASAQPNRIVVKATKDASFTDTSTWYAALYIYQPVIQEAQNA